jgi:hypothetical protein
MDWWGSTIPISRAFISPADDWSYWSLPEMVQSTLKRRPDWVTCSEAQKELEKTNTATIALAGLCGTTSEGRDAEAPEPLPPRVAPPARNRKPSPSARGAT